MKIVSWNMLVNNPNGIGNLKELVEQEPADVYCLQEVTAEVLEYIHDMDWEGWDYIYCFDYRKFQGGYYQNYYLVTLSRHRIENHRVNRIHVNHLTRSSLWDMVMRWDESIEFQYADIEVAGQWYRIFNCHLEVSAGPELRLKQFSQCTDRFVAEGCNIVCGDFNIFAKPKWNWLLWWAMGFKLREIGVDERAEFEAEFERQGVQNPLRGQVTFPERSLQLDHILVPREVQVREVRVVENAYGSDHQPVRVEIGRD